MTHIAYFTHLKSIRRERLTELSRLSRDRDRQAEEAKAALLLGYTGPKQLQELMAKVRENWKPWLNNVQVLVYNT